MKRKVLIIVFCLLILVTLTFGCMPPKEETKDLTLAEVATSVDGLRSEIANLKNTIQPINAQVNSLTAEVESLKSSSGGGVSTVQFADLNNKVVELTNKVNNLPTGGNTTEINQINADLATIKTALADLNEALIAVETRLDDLESPGSSGSSNGRIDADEAIELEMRYFPLYTIKTGGKTLSIPVRLKATNVLTRDINDVVIGISIRLTVDDLDVDKMVLSGGGVTWVGYGSGDTWEFTNWIDIPLDALESKQYTPTLTVTFEAVAAENTDVMIDIESFADDFEYKD